MNKKNSIHANNNYNINSYDEFIRKTKHSSSERREYSTEDNDKYTMENRNPGSNTCNEIFAQMKPNGSIGGDGEVLYNSEQLQNNTPTTGTVRDDEYSFFSVCISQHLHHHKILIHLIPTSAGDVDLYTSTEITRPVAERHTWNSVHVGAENLTLQTNLADWATNSQTLFIGVRGKVRNMANVKAVSFSLEVSVIDMKVPVGISSLRGGRFGT